MRRAILASNLILLAFAQNAAAQAWLPPAGAGNVTVTYQNVLARGHLLWTGERVSGEAGKDPVRSHSMTLDVEYGLTERVALNLSIPFVAARYGGPFPHLLGVSGEPSTVDDGTYHGAFQDFRFGARLNLVSGPLAVTPFVDAIVPSHHYESRGHSVIGLDLRALVLGTNLGAFLDAVQPGLYVHGQVSHAFVQEVAGIRPNRSRLDGELGYFVTPRFAVRFLESFQFTHDGTDFTGDPAQPYRGRETTRQLILNHDRTNRYNFLNLGGGFVFAINESVQVFAAAGNLTWGRNIHPHRGVSVGINWHYQTARAR